MIEHALKVKGALVDLKQDAEKMLQKRYQPLVKASPST